MAEIVTSPPEADQAAFLDEAFSQIDTTQPEMKVSAGPYFKQFDAAMTDLRATVKALDPRLDISNLWPPMYKSPDLIAIEDTITEEREQATQENPEDYRSLISEVWDIKLDWGKTLDAFAAKAGTRLAIQRLDPSYLGVPPYHSQGEQGTYTDYDKTCALAAYRMVFAGIAGWVPGERAMTARLRDRYGSVIVEDALYLRLLATPAFRALTNKRVFSVAMPGADFNHINNLAEKFQNARGNCRTFAVADIATYDSGSRLIWDFSRHKVVLQESDSQGVKCHDPTRSATPWENKIFPHREFTRRWAGAQNMVRLVVAQDIPR